MNYSYCTIEEAWGDNLDKENRKKKKKERKKYNSKYEGYVEDTSYNEGLHNNHCSIEENTNLSNKNRHRHSHGKKPRKIQNKRNDNYQISYSRTNDEYKKYRKETKNISKNKMKPIDKIENEQYLTPSMYNPYSEEEQVSPYEQYNSDTNIENEEKNKYISNSNYESNDNDSGNEYENYSNYNMDLVEGFESNGEDLNNHTISKPGNEEVNDVHSNKKSKRASNLIDKLLEDKNSSPSSSEEMSSEEDNKTDTESEISSDEGENNLNKNEISNKNQN